jgi:hypothetical protein
MKRTGTRVSDEQTDAVKSLIDRLRNGAGSFDLNVPGDDSELQEMITTGARLLVVKGKGVYEIRLADDVDPERKNVNAPNTIQKVLAHGAGAHWVGAILLTGYRLLDRTYLSDAVDIDTAFDLILKLSQDASANYELVERYLEQEQHIIQNLDPTIRQDRSFLVPALGNVEARCKEFLQRADHALKTLFDIVQLFYSDVGRGGWEAFKAKIDQQGAKIDNFPEFLKETVPLLVQVRNARNSVEHPRPEQRIEVADFSLTQASRLQLPTIEIVHPKTGLAPISVREFFVSTMSQIVQISELMVVFLCARHTKPNPTLPVEVVELPECKRRLKSVRYEYGLIIGKDVVPMS